MVAVSGTVLRVSLRCACVCDAAHIGGNRRFEVHLCFSDGMVHCYAPRMEGASSDEWRGASVGVVAEQRMPDMAHMHANLMRSACLKVKFDNRKGLFGRVRFEDAIVGDGILAGFGDPKASVFVAKTGYRCVDRALGWIGEAFADGEVCSLKLVGVQLRLQDVLGVGVFCKNDEPRSILVEAVDGVR